MPWIGRSLPFAFYLSFAERAPIDLFAFSASRINDKLPFLFMIAWSRPNKMLHKYNFLRSPAHAQKTANDFDGRMQSRPHEKGRMTENVMKRNFITHGVCALPSTSLICRLLRFGCAAALSSIVYTISMGPRSLELQSLCCAKAIDAAIECKSTIHSNFISEINCDSIVFWMRRWHRRRHRTQSVWMANSLSSMETTFKNARLSSRISHHQRRNGLMTMDDEKRRTWHDTGAREYNERSTRFWHSHAQHTTHTHTQHAPLHHGSLTIFPFFFSIRFSSSGITIRFTCIAVRLTGLHTFCFAFTMDTHANHQTQQQRGE